ncbi:hypothetical protein SMACR_02831 [Sordaria macrospora]|uniref:WGS project CABT00000000 data, contig 2.12 n=2 Tax=Sordaria macrospora TaxID=5147 RepID=F7VXK9_SORMK|nr:uncharacterized protein SMAC_02831 [Sordaria macrospora k-hell]KAA8634777.1 hypothetical protein SMACR_02831 [Sordaria macrospora]WPJ58186.1 hypothetical protein SMAC4_02831 [Sordaria macrospora]CCC10253.1 unnamed protein product [Sordaria macrospora k-hell]
MSYPGPPGVSKNPTTHPSLPPRPPPAKQTGGFKPAFQPAIHSARSFSTAPSPSPSPAPGYSAPPTTATATSSYAAPPGYGPTLGAAAPGSYGAPNPYGARQPAVPVVGGGRGGYGQANTTYSSYPQAAGYQQQAAYGYGTPGNGSYSTPPQIRNPFPVPNAAPTAAAAGHHGHHHDANYDPLEAAQIAAWQSAYMPKDSNDPNSANNKAAGAGNVPGARGGAGAYGAGAAQYGAAYGAAMDPATAAAAAAAAAAAGTTDPYAAHNANNGATGADGEKKKTVVREGGGKKWTDDTLLEWDPSHLRLFVGNLAGETTDESLLKAFSRWKSVQKAKVVRDKRTTKSKGFGFVSFSDPEDFFQAAKEMNGKYIQSHPVVVHKAKTEIKPTVMKDDRKGGKWKDKKNNHNKEKRSGSGMGAGGDGHGGGGGGGAGGAGGGYEPHLGPAHGGGVTKPGQKTKGGLKLLG